MAEKRVNRAKIGKIETAATRYKKTFQSSLKGFTPLSGYQDSNLGPPAPKAGALTGLRYTPNTLLLKSECKGKNNSDTNQTFRQVLCN